PLSVWNTPVNRGAPDNDYNRSVMQRMAHLIHDANNLQFCNKNGASVSIGINIGNYKPCEMFKIDDLGLFFVLSMADHNLIMATKNTRYETTYSKASFREAIQDPTLSFFMTDG